MSKKVNVILFIALLALLAAPFFQTGSSDAYTYINGFSLLPFENSDANFAVIYNKLGSAGNFLFIIIPILGSVSMIGFIITKKSVFEILAYIIAFIGFCFSIFSVYGFEQFDLSFGYFGTVFGYVLIFVVKIIDYLSSVSDDEVKIWGNARIK